jgi:hypothetical protein
MDIVRGVYINRCAAGRTGGLRECYQSNRSKQAQIRMENAAYLPDAVSARGLRRHHADGYRRTCVANRYIEWESRV